MSKVNKSKSNAISMFFIDLEVTTKELNTETVHNVWEEGKERVVGQLLPNMSLCKNDFLKTMCIHNLIKPPFSSLSFHST